MNGGRRKDVLPLRATMMWRDLPARGAVGGGFGLRAEVARCAVLLVGDQPIVLAGLRALLARERTVRVAGEVVGAAAALKAVPAGAGVVVFATGTWTDACAEALAVLRTRHPGARVVLVLGDGDPVQMRRFLAGGGHAALAMSADLDSLIDAIRAARPDAPASDVMEAGLSGREALVLRRKVHGHTNKTIAAELGLSVKTVETYYTRAKEKLGLQNRSQVLRYALDQGWIAAET